MFRLEFRINSEWTLMDEYSTLELLNAELNTDHVWYRDTFDHRILQVIFDTTREL